MVTQVLSLSERKCFLSMIPARKKLGFSQETTSIKFYIDHYLNEGELIE